MLTLVSVISAPLALDAQELSTFKAVQVTGEVKLREESTGTTVPLKDGRTFQQGYTVITKEDSSAFLLQSNGATIRVQPNTTLSLAEFVQEPFSASAGSYDNLASDPSKSTSRLALEYGEIIINVKKLQPTSSYEVATPVGIAGIRGTVFSISFVRLGTQLSRLMVSVISGSVAVAVPPGSGEETVVEGGDWIQVIFDDRSGEIIKREGSLTPNEIREKSELIQEFEETKSQTSIDVPISTPSLSVDTTIISEGGQ